ncbi:VOC family protein [Vibrio superstes]|uniref:Glyoxalase n=1 Tax=Vibrio superstes NBRC 103154 TaxID=1219062 RepID=A0A511QND1_9VIBR|nr:VOC family protein [Vibrio superstes]GEM78831.1 glyoxalase [Vibrio superstes NBRC 103154]
MAKNPVAWVEIYVDDMPRAIAFYQSVFNVQLEKMDNPAANEIEMWGFPSNMEQYGATGALAKMNGVSAGAGGTLVYFSCEDCAIEEARVVSSGGSIQQPKMAIGEYGFMTLATDTEGNMFGLHSMD